MKIVMEIKRMKRDFKKNKISLWLWFVIIILMIILAIFLFNTDCSSNILICFTEKIIPIGTFFGLIFTLIIVSRNLDVAKKDFQTRLRPFIGIEKIDNYDSPDGGLIYIIRLKNFGNIPANKIEREFKLYLNGTDASEKILPTQTEILSVMPSQVTNFEGGVPRDILEKILKDQGFINLEINIKYQGILKEKFTKDDIFYYHMKAKLDHTARGFSWAIISSAAN